MNLSLSQLLDRLIVIAHVGGMVLAMMKCHNLATDNWFQCRGRIR